MSKCISADRSYPEPTDLWLRRVGPLSGTYRSLQSSTQLFEAATAISAYQKMGLAAIVYGGGLSLFSPSPVSPLPDITRGLVLAFNPLLILGLQLLWCTLFFIFGRSIVTSASLSFAVRHDRI